MDLFKLLGTITVNNSDANKALDETSKKGQDTESKLGKVFSGIGKGAAVVGKVVGTGMVAAGGAIVGLVTKSTQAYAEYEQLVGGVDTLFKSSSAKVQAYAENAYKTAGLSANEYMNTVTSFSASLLQSLGGDTEKAADKANVAITDMSDNANKMGTSMESIQNAYQGFAKQNYTMLDNLKLGYGGTKEEMQRLLSDAEKISGQKFDLSSYADVVDAIHVIQTEMGITGTTAKEASGTISGSAGSMKAAWQNLVTAMSSDNLPLGEYIDKFVASATAMVENMLPRIQQALVGVVQLVNELAPVIIGKVPELFSQLLPSVIEAATGLINAIVTILPDLVQALLDMIPAFVDGFVQIVNAIIEAFPQIAQTLVSALPTLLPILISGLASMAVTICENLLPTLQPLFDALPDIIVTLVDALLTNLPIIMEAMITMTLALVEALPQIIQALVDATPTIVEMVVTALLENLPMLIQGAIQLVLGICSALPQILSSLIQALPNALKGIWEAIKNVFAPVGDWFGEKFGIARDAIVEAWSTVSDWFSGVWNKICEIFAPVINFFKVMFENAWIAVKAVWSVVAKFFEIVWALICAVFKPVINFFKDIFSKAWEAIKTVWDSVTGFFKNLWTGVKNIFSPVGNWFKEKFSQAWNGIKNIFSNVKGFFLEKWNQIKEVFSSLGTTISDSISGAVKKGINGLIGGAENIINGFFKMINKAIGAINEIPGVEISEIKLIQFKRLAKGGVVDKPTPAVFGEDGAEAVVPLEHNTGWLNKVALKLHEFSLQYKGGFDANTSIRSMELQQAQVSELQALNATADKILDAILTVDDNMGGHLRDAIDGMSFSVGKREFGRLVKETI